MKETKNTCILCGYAGKSDKIASKLRDSTSHSVVRCIRCGHVQISPIPSPEEEKKFYDLNKQPKNVGIKISIDSLKGRQRYDIIRRANFVSGRTKPGSSILDVGSSYGFFLDEMRNRGYKANGIEISKERLEISKKVTRAKVFKINLLENSVNIGKYDVITISHILEHVSLPIKLCYILKYYLKSGGCVIAEVPNLDDPMLLASKGYKSFWWQRAHISYFSQNTLLRVFREAGYKNIKITGVQRYGIDNMMNWLCRGKPQVDSPNFETKGQYKWLEKYYKSYLERRKTCDTLIVIANL